MAKNHKNLGRQVKDFRLSRLMTQDQAASFFGLSKATYVRVELGKGCGALTQSKINKVLSQVLQAA